MARASATRIFARLGVAALGAAALAAAVFFAQRPADAPVEVPLDRVACAHCGMLVSELSFAGQLHTLRGEVHFYDDPGCLLLDAEERGAELRRLWFHDHAAERWLSAEEVSFAPIDPTPMGYGLAALARGEGPLDRAAALAFVREREAARRAERP